MNLIIFLVIIFVALIVDFLWLDMESKRWKWLKSQSKPQQILFFTSFFRRFNDSLFSIWIKISKLIKTPYHLSEIHISYRDYNGLAKFISWESHRMGSSFIFPFNYLPLIFITNSSFKVNWQPHVHLNLIGAFAPLLLVVE